MRLSPSANVEQCAWERVCVERGIAVLIALLFAALIGAVAAGLIALATTAHSLAPAFATATRRLMVPRLPPNARCAIWR